MSLLAVIVRGLIRWLPQDEREAISLELDEVVEEPAGPAVTAEAERVDGDDPDWQYVWRALISASGKASQIQNLLSDRRAFFDFSDITDTAAQLRGTLDRAYALMCRAPWLDGLTLDIGDDLDTVRHRVDVRRAEVVDAELAAMQPAPPPDAPVWSIDYRQHGGFIATGQPGDGTQPWKFWGIAPTARSAAHVLNWYFLNEPPTITFDPPQPVTPWPLATIGPNSDLSPEGPSIEDLLDRRDDVYEQHLAACRSARVLLNERGDVRQHLADRAAELNSTDPQLPNADSLGSIDCPQNTDHGGSAQTVQWVPTSLVVATGCPTWGEFGGHRDNAPHQIVAGLLTSDLDQFTYRLFTDRIGLLRSPGWAGPLYRIGWNGTHRVHTMRMLNLPWLAAAVDTESIATSWDMLGLVAADRDHDRDQDEARRRSLDERLEERAMLVEGLLRRGLIDGELRTADQQLVLHCRWLPAAWLLRAPNYATRINAIYESRYPGALAQLGIPHAVGTDPVAWTVWLVR